MKLTLASLLLIAAANGCGGFDSQQAATAALAAAPPAGTDCSVCLRRDALGAPNRQWLDPTTVSVDQTDIAITGKFVAADHDWITLDTQPGPNHGVPVRIWIPREAVLAVAQRR